MFAKLWEQTFIVSFDFRSQPLLKQDLLTISELPLI
jgi:hypothetical protein